MPCKTKPIPSSVTESIRHIIESFTESDKCWEWPLSRNSQTGYGQVSRYIDGKHSMFAAHRVSFVLAHGEPEPGKLICHKCDNRCCVNPSHLYAGDQKQNTLDTILRNKTISYKSRAEKRSGENHWTKKKAHTAVMGELSHSAKLNADAVVEIRSSKEKGRALAKRFCVSATTISAIRKRKTWKHI